MDSCAAFKVIGRVEGANAKYSSGTTGNTYEESPSPFRARCASGPFPKALLRFTRQPSDFRGHQLLRADMQSCSHKSELIAITETPHADPVMHPHLRSCRPRQRVILFLGDQPRHVVALRRDLSEERYDLCRQPVGRLDIHKRLFTESVK